MRSCLVCLLLLVSLPAFAQIYKYTDADGNTAYSNEPPNGTASETVELPPLNSVQPQPQTLPQAHVPRNKGVAAPAYDTLQLTDIPTAEALRANNGTFTVGVDLAPRLQPGHVLRLQLDGKPYGQPSNVPRLQLVNVDRGEHSLAVQVLSNGELVQQSPTVTFTVQRVHVP
ncbi:DUF4124 domain-containing protein [Pseudomonas abieticivorans]|uniref:DUF4124 domain-containing protein n=1 Tax=Pseudomonas abieticivorans TaxID=2931382 RepID=UPI0020C0F576|nr:DUF4124 domain-containing protein [Pseudomonas sp. PIA16]